MGQDVEEKKYTSKDFKEFESRLQSETEQLKSWINEKKFSSTNTRFGFELELWLLDQELQACPLIEEFLGGSDDPQMVSELAAFNLELNGEPTSVGPMAAHQFHQHMEDSWEKALQRAADLDLKVLMIGVLPNLNPEDINQSNMSPMRRYKALNQQVMRMRKGHPLQIDIHGEDQLHLQIENVMLESACTSTQLHLQVPITDAVKAYNISKMLSAAMVAISANSPLLFNKFLWDETRIPLFEQSIDVGASDLTSRVTFGLRYAENSIFEAFEANLNRYPVLLPALFEDDGQLPHLHFHNGTIWRWNRPLVGFGSDGPHFRIEHRVMPAGPSVVDTVANAMLFYGALQALLSEDNLEKRLPFERAKDSFYRAAKGSLHAELDWLDQQKLPADLLILEHILPLAERGLKELGIEDAESYLKIIQARASQKINGAIWQKTYTRQKHADIHDMLSAYYERQQSGLPVHLWGFA